MVFLKLLRKCMSSEEGGFYVHWPQRSELSGNPQHFHFGIDIKPVA